MSSQMNEENKRWIAKRKSALVLEIIQGKTTVAEASRQSSAQWAVDRAFKKCH